MTKEHQAQILGKETYLVTSTAASYLLDVSYLSVLAVATTACGASGLLGLLHNYKWVKGASYVLVYLLCSFCAINGFIEIGIGIYGSTKGNMFKDYRTLFLDMTVMEEAGAPIDASSANDSNDLGSATTRAIQASALHFWLAFWFTLAAVILWCLGDSLGRLVCCAIDDGTGREDARLLRSISSIGSRHSFNSCNNTNGRSRNRRQGGGGRRSVISDV